MTFTHVARTGDLPDGQMKRVDLNGQPILLARVGDQYFATQNTCPHIGGDLSKGTLQGTIVTCPRHRSQFDLRDGRVLRWTDWSGLTLRVAKLFKSPRPLTVFEVRVEDGDILVGVGD